MASSFWGLEKKNLLEESFLQTMSGFYMGKYLITIYQHSHFFRLLYFYCSTHQVSSKAAYKNINTIIKNIKQEPQRTA